MSIALLLFSPVRAGVVISEIHYHPPEVSGEFVELYNAGDGDVDLLAWSFTRGIRYAFGESFVLAPGEFLIVARDRRAFVAEQPRIEGIAVGDYDGALDDDGDRLTLVDAEGRVVDDVRYEDDYPYDARADGRGWSLERVCLSAPATHPFNWAARAPSAGSRGAESCPPSPLAPDAETRPIIINEIQYHPVAASNGADTPREYVELFNRGSSAVEVSGWHFDRGISFTVPAGRTLPPGGYLLIAEDPAALRDAFDLDADLVLGPFADGSHLSNSGEALRLVDRDGVLQDEVRYRDSGLWPALADGLGASLQRVDPLGPSGAPGNWRAISSGDEGGAGEWKNLEARGFHDGPRFYIYLLGAGSMLVDDVRLVDEQGNDFIANGGFDSGLGSWSGTGTHSGTRVLATGGFGDGGPCMLVEATESGSGFEGVRQTFDPRPPVDARLTLSMRVKAIDAESRFIARSSIARGDDGLIYLEADAKSGRELGDGGTPLAPNSVGGPGTPPTIELAQRPEAWPSSGEEVAIAARVIAEDELDEVALVYRAGEGAEAEVALLDDGGGSDAVAGDSVFSGTVPPAGDGALVWYSLRARTRGGLVTTWPRSGDPVGETGYYVADDPPDSNDSVRLFYIFTPGALGDLTCDEGQYRSGDFVDHTGRAYRRVGVKYRGETACFYPKKPIRVRFNRGDRFEGQSHLNFNAGWNDKSMLREEIGFRLFEEAGVARCETHLARVHTNGGAFYGAYVTVEDPDDDYLARNRRDPDGGLYKCRTPMRSGGTGGLEPRSDASVGQLAAVGDFATQINARSGQSLVDYLERNLDVEAFIDYQALQVIIIDGDSVAKNWLLYYGRHELGTETAPRVTAFAWDIDLSFGQMLLTTDVRNYDIHPLFQCRSYPFHDQGYHGIITALLESPPNDYFVKAYYGRLWSLLEEKFHPDRLIPVLDRYDDQTIATVRDDLRRWPRSWGQRGTDPDYWRADFRQFVRRRHAFLTQYLLGENPTSQGRRFRYTPAPRLRFTEIHYNPPEDEALEFVEIHSLAETDTDLGAWVISPLDWTFPAGTTIGAGETVIVAKSPPHARLLLEEEVRVFGPYDGELGNGGAVLALYDDGNGGRYYREMIDRVIFEDGGDWPSDADGDGLSLELIDVSRDNDLVASWRGGWSPGIVRPLNLAPVIVARVTPASGPSPLAVLLDATGSSDPEDDRLSFRWELPSGAVETRAALRTRLTGEGRHEIRLVVTDAFGAESSETFHVDVGGAPSFRRADANDDSVVDLADPIRVLGFLFLGAAPLSCPDAGDADDNGVLEITDAVATLAYLFSGGGPPALPGPDICGFDPTVDDAGPCDSTGCR